MKRFIVFIVVAIVVSLGLIALVAGGIFGLGNFFLQADPLLVLALVAAGFAASSFAFGLITGDYSWVDRLWSTAPVVFVWFYLFRSGFEVHLLVVAAVVTVWGARLTYNFARKGGYSGEEDYRWAILRGQITNPVLWQLFNLLFISAFQIALFLGFTIPAWVLFHHPDLVSEPLFVAFSILALAAVVYETVADQQQWNFHVLKTAARQGKDVSASALAEDVKRGFLSSGLFAHSRHPNYFGELGTWWALWLAAALGTGHVLELTMVGPVVLTALFIGSTDFTEKLSASKYPAYADYQRRVIPIVPWVSSAAQNEALDEKR